MYDYFALVLIRQCLRLCRSRVNDHSRCLRLTPVIVTGRISRSIKFCVLCAQCDRTIKYRMNQKRDAEKNGNRNNKKKKIHKKIRMYVTRYRLLFRLPPCLCSCTRAAFTDILLLKRDFSVCDRLPPSLPPSLRIPRASPSRQLPRKYIDFKLATTSRVHTHQRLVYLYCEKKRGKKKPVNYCLDT